VLSAYRIVWFFALFDLPVMTKPQRCDASRFRFDLLDLGFQWCSFQSTRGRAIASRLTPF